MVSKVVFVVILAVISGTRALYNSANLDGINNQIHEAIEKLDLALDQSELNENKLTTRFNSSSAIIMAIHKVFQIQRIAARVFRKGIMTAQKIIFTPLRTAYVLADKVEDQVKNQIDEARKNIENLLKEANTQGSNAMECAVQSAEPFQGVSEKLYQNTKRCLIDRIDPMVESELNIVEQILLAVEIVTSVDLIIANCLAGLDNKPSFWAIAKAGVCLAKVGLKLALVPVRIYIEVARMYNTVQTFNPMLTACAALKGAIAGKEITVVAYNVGRCLMT